MDLIKTGKLLCNLRKEKGMTQKQVAEMLGVLPKTVSKWETGKGFPDVATLSTLADILGVSERNLLSGSIVHNKGKSANMKRTKFYTCQQCGNLVRTTGDCRIVCCGKPLEELISQQPDEAHKITVSRVEDDFYVEFNHEMTKEHFISFASYVGFDRVLTVKLYPEQEAVVRFPRMFRGTFYYYCNEHGLFEYKF